jgi:chemotaxis protein MotA
MSGYIGLLIGLVSLVMGFLLEGGHLGSLLQPTAGLIVFGGTIGAVMVSYPGEQLKNFIKAINIAFKPKKGNNVELIKYFKEMSIKTRKNGLLSIEEEIEKSTDVDPFVVKGMKMVIDGTEPEILKNALELQLENMVERHKANAAMFESAGGFAPTMGIIGTVLGLVHILGSLDGDPGQLAPKIATAFIATLYGVASANVLWLPIATKLKEINKKEIAEKLLIIEGITLIQSGTNPNIIEEQLKGFLDKQEIEAYTKIAGGIE